MAVQHEASFAAAADERGAGKSASSDAVYSTIANHGI